VLLFVSQVMVDKDQLEATKSSKSPLAAKFGVLASQVPQASLSFGNSPPNASITGPRTINH